MFGNQSQFKQQKYQQFEVRKTGYGQTWNTELKTACCADPGFAISVCSPNCISYMLRKQLIYNDMTRYVCCNGDCPCSGRMAEQSCPEFCLCMEVFVCFTQSVASTRWAIQDQQRIMNTPCDNCLIGTMVFCQYLACLCDIAACLSGSQELAEIANFIDQIAQLIWCSVCACMQTQHKVQLDARDKGQGPAGAPQGPYQAPMQQAIPPPGVQGQYGPAPGSGYPPQGYPQPQNTGVNPQGGYPMTGYPPPAQRQQQQQGYPQQLPGYPPKQGYPQQGYPQQQPYPAQQMQR
ncbi:TPA: hypothetical protein ACH3X3_012829 [Trebouxia sp. C0006]